MKTLAPDAASERAIAVSLAAPQEKAAPPEHRCTNSNVSADPGNQGNLTRQTIIYHSYQTVQDSFLLICHD
jgi:hypothetical protein